MSKFDSQIKKFIDIQSCPGSYYNITEAIQNDLIDNNTWTDNDTMMFLNAIKNEEWTDALSILMKDPTVPTILSTEKLERIRIDTENTIADFAAGFNNINNTTNEIGNNEDNAVNENNGSTDNNKSYNDLPPNQDEIQTTLNRINDVVGKIKYMTSEKNLIFMFNNLKKAYEGKYKDNMKKLGTLAEKSGWQTWIQNIGNAFKYELGGINKIKEEQFNKVMNNYINENLMIINENKLFMVILKQIGWGVGYAIIMGIINLIGTMWMKSAEMPFKILLLIIKYLNKYKPFLLKLLFPVNNMGVMIIGPDGGKNMGSEIEKWVDNIIGFVLDLTDDLVNLVGVSDMLNSLKSTGRDISHKISGPINRAILSKTGTGIKVK